MSGQVETGDKVAWNWNGSHPSGTVSEVKPGEVTVVSHRGNEISKSGTEENPAVHIERSGNDVVKTADELHVTKKAPSSAETNGHSNGENKGDTEGHSNGVASSHKEEKKGEETESHKPDEPKAEQKRPENETAQTGDKRKADEKVDAHEQREEKLEEDDNKKQKTSNGKAENAIPANGEKKKPGRPKGGNGDAKAKKEKKAPAVGRAARKTRSQGAA